MSGENDDAVRRKTAIAEYRKKLLNHKELEGRVRSGNPSPNDLRLFINHLTSSIPLF